MNTMLISALAVLTVFTICKKIPLYGFYDMLTCISVLLMAILSIAGLAFNTAFNVYSLIFIFGIISSIICCYGLRSRNPFKKEQIF